MTISGSVEREIPFHIPKPWMPNLRRIEEIDTTILKPIVGILLLVIRATINKEILIVIMLQIPSNATSSNRNTNNGNRNHTYIPKTLNPEP